MSTSWRKNVHISTALDAVLDNIDGSHARTIGITSITAKDRYSLDIVIGERTTCTRGALRRRIRFDL